MLRDSVLASGQLHFFPGDLCHAFHDRGSSIRKRRFIFRTQPVEVNLVRYAFEVEVAGFRHTEILNGRGPMAGWDMFECATEYFEARLPSFRHIFELALNHCKEIGRA